MIWNRVFGVAAMVAIGLFAASTLIVAQPAIAADAKIESKVDGSKLKKSKQTNLGLYVTAGEAAEALKKDPNALLVDIRARGEIMFVGGPTDTDKIIPYAEFGDYKFDEKKGAYKMVANPNFAEAIDALVEERDGNKDTTIILMCRSGSRSASGADILAKRGYTNVYSMVDGFEGDKDKEGRRTVNGWRNADLPWSYKMDETAIYKSPID